MNSPDPQCRLIYLDQFAASSMVDSQGMGVWQEVEDLLREGVANGRLLCPIPSEHWLETAHRPLSVMQQQTALFNGLSGGYHILGAPFAAAKAMSARMRGTVLTRYDYIVKEEVRRELDTDVQQKLRSERDLLGIRLNPALEDANWIRSLTRPGLVANKWKPFSFSVSEFFAKQEFLERLNTLLEEGGIRIRGAGFPGSDVAHWVDLFLEILMKHHRMTTSEAERLYDEVQQVGFMNIPPVHIRNTLVDHMAHRHKKETDGDHIDLLRMATALPVTHIALVDGPRKQELVETGLAVKYGCRVFSGRSVDLAELVATLEPLAVS